MQLSEHFSLEELTITAHRHLDNTPPAQVLTRLPLLAEGLELVREILGGAPMHINSGYRSPAVNHAVGGSPTSGHMLGWAADWICPAFGPPIVICRAIAASALRFDQMIEEGTWVHLSFDPRLRGEVLTKRPGGGYQAGLRAG